MTGRHNVRRFVLHVLTALLAGNALLLCCHLVQAVRAYWLEVSLPGADKALVVALTAVAVLVPLLLGAVAWRQRRQEWVVVALLLCTVAAFSARAEYRLRVRVAQQQLLEFNRFVQEICFTPVVRAPDTATLTPTRFGPYTGMVTVLAGVLAQQREAQAAIDRFLAADRTGGRLFTTPTFASTAAVRAMRRELDSVRALLEVRRRESPLQEALTALQHADGPDAVREKLCATLRRDHAGADAQAQASALALLAAVDAADAVYAHLAGHTAEYEFTNGRLQFHVTATASRHMHLLAAANAQLQRHQQLSNLRPRFTAAI